MKTVLLCPLLLLAACHTGPSTDFRSAELQRKYDEAVRTRTLVLGMTTREVTAVLGQPARKREEQFRRIRVVRWSYPDRTLDVIFDREGFLIRWETPFG